jgi:AraC family transcriptional regulator, exoenzyme S synthesis regulatory protein ExsA
MINYYQLLLDNPGFFKQFSCNDVLFLNYDCPVKEKKIAKWSQHNYIYYVLSGQKIMHTPERPWTLTKGTATFVKKGACIVEQFHEEPFCIVVFVIPDSFIRTFLEENGSFLRRQSSPPTPELVIPIEPDEMLHAFYQSILPYFETKQALPERMIELKFTELLLHILSNPMNSKLIDYMRSVANERVVSIEQTMDLNYAYNLSLQEYATLCNRSLSSFKRDFKEIYKTTPGKWLLERKLQRANFLLTTTNKPISDIAFESGFENITHFSRVFKQKFGNPPVNYRKSFESKLIHSN